MGKRNGRAWSRKGPASGTFTAVAKVISFLGSWQEAGGFWVQEWTTRFPFLFLFLWHAMGRVGLWTGLHLYSVIWSLLQLTFLLSPDFHNSSGFYLCVFPPCGVWGGAWKVGWCGDMASFSSCVFYHSFGPFLDFPPLRFSSLCVYSYVMKLLLACASYKGERSDA